MIHRQSQKGERVVVVTICAAAPAAGPLSPFAAALHARWSPWPMTADAVDAADHEDAAGDPAAMVSRRRAEDEAALRRLGAEGMYLGVPDAIYRRDPRGGGWLIGSDADLFNGFLPAEAGLADAVARRLAAFAGSSRPVVHVPLAIGDHVDHWLVRRAAESWARDDPEAAARMIYFEDYPYSEHDGAIARAVDDRGRDESTPPATWRDVRVDLDEADLRAKCDAIAAYASQISSFWPDVAAMERAVRAFAARRGEGGRPAERLWRREGAASPLSGTG